MKNPETNCFYKCSSISSTGNFFYLWLFGSHDWHTTCYKKATLQRRTNTPLFSVLNCLCPYGLCQSQEYMDGHSVRLGGESPPALLYALRDWDLQVQILPKGQGPIYLTDLMKCPILCHSSPWGGITFSILHAPHICRLLALFSFDLMSSWFKGLKWEENNCTGRREALGAGSAHWGGSLLAQTETDGRQRRARDKRGKGGVTLTPWAVTGD